MQHKSICSECNRPCTIEYDENDGTLVFCPFCGEDGFDENGDLTYSDDAEWDDGDDEDEELSQSL
jgi:hypothetical protein